MSDTRELFEELKRAVNDGDLDRAQEIRNKILLGGRDKSIDKNFLDTIKEKTLGKNLLKILLDDVDGRDTLWFTKTLSSLITHMLIECERGINKSDIGLHEAYIILGKFINDNGEAEYEFKKFIDERYSEFFKN